MTTSLKISKEAFRKLQTQPGGMQHLEELRVIEKQFHSSFELKKFYESLNKHLADRLKEGAIPTLQDLQEIDSFTRKYFYGKMPEIEMWLVRGFVIGKLIEKAETLPPPPRKVLDIEKLPTRVRDAARDYKLTVRETRALEWNVSNGAKSLTNATSRTVGRVQELLYDNLKNRGSIRDFRRALETEFFDDEHELNRDWKRVAITETNAAFNNGYLVQVPPSEWVIGMSLINCCPQCSRLIDGKIFPVIEPAEDMTYDNLDPESKEYKKRSWLWANTVWTGKDNVGRSPSPYKKMTGENGEPVLVERAHYELYMPSIPCHPYCRCRWIRLKPLNQYIENGNIRMRAMDEKAWEKWYNADIITKLTELKQHGIEL